MENTAGWIICGSRTEEFLPDCAPDIGFWDALSAAKDSFGVMSLYVLKDNGIKCDFVTIALPSPASRTILSGSQGLYQWSAISSASPFTTGTWCLIFAISFWKFETRLKEWNFWRPLSSWRLHHRSYEKEEEESDPPLLSVSRPSCPLRSDFNTFSFYNPLSHSNFQSGFGHKNDTALSKVLKRSFLAKSRHVLKISPHSLPIFDCIYTAFSFVKWRILMVPSP